MKDGDRLLIIAIMTPVVNGQATVLLKDIVSGGRIDDLEDVQMSLKYNHPTNQD